MERSPVIIAGAGPAGLALAACLENAGIGYLILEKQEEAATGWRRCHDRLHLHTPRSISTLPFLDFPAGVPRFPSRDQFVAYLDEYAKNFNIRPRFRSEILSATRTGALWTVRTAQTTYQTSTLILATGRNYRPRPFDVTGIKTFPGQVIHSNAFRSGADFQGLRVLVIGFGNSAAEIALDLSEQGLTPVVAVRGPVNVIPRTLFGIPVLHWAKWLSRFSPKVSDRLSAPLLRLALGNLSNTGLRKATYGPSVQVAELGKIPAIDTGTLRRIRAGKIRITGAVQSVNGDEILFSDGTTGRFDVIILATGYEPGTFPLTGISAERRDNLEKPFPKQTMFGLDSLYSCGFAASGTGMLRAISDEARHITEHLRRQRSATGSGSPVNHQLQNKP